MPNEHIVKSFDDELAVLDQIIASMGGLAERQLVNAVNALLARDEEAAATVIEADVRIDELEDRLNAQAMRLLALRHPFAEDLRTVIAALKMSSDLERIGDYAKNIAKRTRALTEFPPKSTAATLERMADLVEQMIAQVLDAYITRDVSKARDVRERDDAVDALHTALFRELLTHMIERPSSITAGTHLLFVAKNIERIGDHATNVAEDVCFMVEGRRPADERPKSDTASLTAVKPDSED